MRRTLAVALLLLGLPVVARAEDDERGATAAIAVSATNMESRTEPTVSGTFGYRFSGIVSFEIEATVVPKLRSGFTPGAIIQTVDTTDVLSSSLLTGLTGTSVLIFPGPTITNTSGRVVLFSNNARIDIPTTSTRITPFFVAGGGVAHIRKTADYSYTFPITTNPFLPPTAVPPSRSFTQRLVSSEIDLALTLGGGVDVWVTEHAAVTGDLRLYRLLGGQDDRNAGRFGLGMRYRF